VSDLSVCPPNFRIREGVGLEKSHVSKAGHGVSGVLLSDEDSDLPYPDAREKVELKEAR
jgi:hypothetical protein